MKIELILVMLLMLIPYEIASSRDITSKEDIKAASRFATINESVDPVYWCNTGDNLFSSGKYDASIEAYNRSIELNQSYVEAWINKGVALDNLGKYDEAAKAFEEAKKLEPKSYGMFNITDYKLMHANEIKQQQETGKVRSLT